MVEDPGPVWPLLLFLTLPLWLTAIGLTFTIRLINCAFGFAVALGKVDLEEQTIELQKDAMILAKNDQELTAKRERREKEDKGTRAARFKESLDAKMQRDAFAASEKDRLAVEKAMRDQEKREESARKKAEKERIKEEKRRQKEAEKLAKKKLDLEFKLKEKELELSLKPPKKPRKPRKAKSSQ